MPLALLAASAPAAPTLDQERAALTRASAQAGAARKRAEALEASATRTAAAADRARDSAAALAARIQQSEADLRANEARIAIIAAQQREQAHRLALRQGPIARLAAALQQIARRSPLLAFVEPGSISDAVHRRIVLAHMLPIIKARTRNLRTELARSADLRRGAEVATASLRRTRDALADQRRALAVIEQRQRLAARGLRDTAGVEAEHALALGEQARDIGALLTQIEAAGSVREALMRLPGPTLRPATPGSATPAMGVAMPAPQQGPPSWRLPVVGEVVTGFGELADNGLRARGLTIAVAPSALVVAPAAGRVAFAGAFRGYGDIIVIEHGGSWTTLIANLAALSAHVGDELRAGDPLGSAGPGQPQLLVELRQGDRPVDIAALAR